MRDASRINRIVTKWKALAERFPQVEFMQLVLTVLRRDVFFYLEDDIIEQKLDVYDVNAGDFMDGPVPKDSTIDIFTVFEEIWSKVPDWRFTQLLSNVFVGFDYATDYYEALGNDIVISVLRDAQAELINGGIQ